jgi:iron(III) transport system permease protein
MALTKPRPAAEPDSAAVAPPRPRPEVLPPPRRSRLDLWSAATLGVAALVAVPVVVVVASVAFPAGEVWRHLASTVLWRYVENSLWLAIGTGLGTLVIGVTAAWLVTMCRFPGRRVFEWLLFLPLAMPAYVIAYTYTGLLESAGPVQGALRSLFGPGFSLPPIRSFGGAIAMMTLVLYPYVYLLGRAAFLEQSVCVLDASRTLGRGPWRSFFTVALPLARPAIVAGLALVLMETLNDYGTVQYFAVDTFTTGIYRAWFGMGSPLAAAQLGAVLMIFVFVLLAVERRSRGRARFHHTTSRYRALPRYELRGPRAALAVVACALPILLGFLLPVGVLAAWTVETGPRVLDARFVWFARNSFILATLAALLALAVGLALAYRLRQRPGRITTGAVRLAGMGYAVPGSVIAVGLLLPLARLDNAIDAALHSWLGVSVGLVFTGGVAALLYAYLVRFLAVSLGSLEAGLAKVTPNIDDAARTLGCTPREVVTRVHAPVMRGSLLTAALLVFVDVMKELPATLIMRPFNFDTLAVRAHQLAADERLRDAAVPGLAIVLVGIVPLVLLSAAIARSRPGHGR